MWLNNPRRPLEASGTSGMKAALNGVLNLSDPRRLVARGLRARRERLGDRRRHRGRPPDEHDARDHAALLRVLEDEVLPAYQERPRWLAMMRASVRMAAERFSAERMVREYFDRLYGDA